MILGTGLGDLADEVESPIVLPYAMIPHHPRPTVEGHAGELVVGTLEGVEVAVWRGRVHLYEGWSMEEISFGVRVAQRLGAGALFLTNAAGGLNPAFTSGDLMLIRDHINLPGLVGHSPLWGLNDPSLGPRFLDMSGAYDAALAGLAIEAGRRVGQPLREGVYAMVAGPSYETPAEGRLLRLLGADAVGMSTVPEVLVAAQVGLRVVALSAITNMVALAPGTVATSHAEVLATAARVKTRFSLQMRAMLAAMRTAL